MHSVFRNAPQGSAILAYGSAPASRNTVRLVLLATIAFFLVVFIGVACLYSFASFPVPVDNLLMISVQPKHLSSVISGDLLKELPPPWRAAIETRSSFPVVLGITSSQEHTESYAIVPRHVAIAQTDNVHRTNRLFVYLLTETPDTVTTSTSFHTILKLMQRASHSDAAWLLNASAFERLISSTPFVKSGEWISGTWSGISGVIDFSDELFAMHAPQSAPLSATFTKNEREFTPITSALKTQGVDIHHTEQPQFILREEGGLITLGWSEAPDENDRGRIAASFGFVSSAPYELPDASISFEQLAAPVTESVSPFFISRDGMNKISNERIDESNCTGEHRLTIASNVLDNLLERSNLSKFLADRIESIRFYQHPFHVQVCVSPQ